jgi:dihydroorotase
MKPLVIRNACIVNEGREVEGDVLVRAGRIERVGGSIEVPDGAQVLDAGGKLLLPGFIDDQVHFREPGLTRKGDLYTESTAAVAGGITSVMEMPNVSPPTTNRAALANKYARASGRMRANYAFYMGASNDNINEIRALEPGDACGVKCFMGASTGNLLVDDPDALEKLFADSPLLIVTHCEDSPMIRANEQAAREKYGDDVPIAEHPAIRSAEACFKSSSYAIDLARRNDARLHVLHLTTAREMELFEPGPIADKQITAEVCVHHLFFDDSDYERLGARIKCNPAIKSAADREALLAAVRDDRIDIIATDHAPHLASEKAGKYFDAPAGLPLVQHALLTLFEHYHDQRLTLGQIVGKTSHAVADLFGVVDRGYIREGYWADLVLVDPDGGTAAGPETVLSKCGWSPFDGYRFRASIAATLVNGEIAWRDGSVTGGIYGQRLEFRAR